MTNLDTKGSSPSGDKVDKFLNDLKVETVAEDDCKNLFDIGRLLTTSHFYFINVANNTYSDDWRCASCTSWRYVEGFFCCCTFFFYYKNLVGSGEKNYIKTSSTPTLSNECRQAEKYIKFGHTDIINLCNMINIP